jgi:selenocysteine lyase/cysteine desulfurase
LTSVSFPVSLFFWASTTRFPTFFLSFESFFFYYCSSGNGATSAVELLIDCLGLKHAVAVAAAATSSTRRPIVFVGPYEHHSNLVTWRETGSEIVHIPECPITRHGPDLAALEERLQYYHHQEKEQQHRPGEKIGSTVRLKMGTFTAASNVTGKLCDTLAISALLHRYGALAFFDYATAAPYCSSTISHSTSVEMDMNPTAPLSSSLHDDDEDAGASGSGRSSSSSSIYAKDAMFISPHKLLGGSSGTPGILVVKKHLVSQANAPSRSGGGTVFYVTHNHHRFLSNRIERYEGGTPHIVGIIRAGLTFLYKRQVEQHYARIVDAATVTAATATDGTTATSVAATTTATCTNNNADSVNKSDIDKAISNQEPSSLPLLPKTIFDHDCMTHQRVVTYLTKHAPNLILLGVNNDKKNGTSCINSNNNKHLPIFSFLIQWGRRFLHFNYVSAILNDLFGIQSRGGCQCAGPYSQSLLGLTEMVIPATGMSSSSSSSNSTKQRQHLRQEMPNARNKAIEAALVQYKERAELLRPGYTRISLPFKGLHSFEIDYVLKALVWVSQHAWELMPQYRVNHRTGEVSKHLAGFYSLLFVYPSSHACVPCFPFLVETLQSSREATGF